MHPYSEALYQTLAEHADPSIAGPQKAYMLNQFPFFGLKAQKRDLLARDFFKGRDRLTMADLEQVVKDLWGRDERECHYLGIDIVAYHKKLWKEEIIELITYLLTHKSWWDTVDGIASDCLGDYFKMFPRQIVPITSDWNKSDNFWLQRSSIMFQKTYKGATNTEILKQYILNLSSSKEFFVQKAIGWALREYSKTDPGWVSDFVNIYTLAPLSKREAMKWINKKAMS